MNYTEVLYNATLTANKEMVGVEDTKYGCGSTFITISKGQQKFVNYLKNTGLVKKDGYYGNILELDNPFNGTLEQEQWNNIVSRELNNNGIKTFVHTRLD